MKTKVLEVSLRDREKAAKAVGLAAKEILLGNLVIIPTETSYGIAADATNLKAVQKLFELTEKPAKEPIPIIVSDLNLAKEHSIVNPTAEFLARNFMPGPLTLIVEKKDSISNLVSSDGIAFRISSNSFARAISSEAGVPITASKTNKEGEAAHYLAWKVRETFNGKVPLILLTGDLQEVPASTILDTRSFPPKLIREGPVPYKEIESQLSRFNAAGNLQVATV